MGMGMMGMNMGGGMGMPLGGMGMGMGMGGMGMGMMGMGGLPRPLGMGDVSGSAGGDSEARADTDADAEESDAGGGSNSNPNAGSTLAPRRRGEDDAQTQQTPRAGVVRLPSPASSSPGAGPSPASSSVAVYDEDEGEGEVVVAVRSSSSSSSSGTMRRASTVRATQTRQHPVSDAGASGSTGADRDRGDTAGQPTASSSSSASISAPLPAAAPRASQHHTPYPGAPRVPAAPTPAVRARRATATDAPDPAPVPAIPTATPTATRARERDLDRHHHSHAHAHAHPTGPYRDEDVLLSLQLLAYLSKYPHVRQAFYKRRNGFHPASALAVAAAKAAAAETPEQPLPKAPEIVRENKARQSQTGQQLAFLRAFGVAGKDKEKGKAPAGGSSSSRASTASTAAPVAPASTASTAARPGFETNVFSLVERFTFRPSSSETDLPNPPPKLPQEIQYWAGVIMRNACRKDDSRGGIRQCANMLCGRWEEYPREFAKCRRCRKAKYCGKECQSTAWSEGHRFWCSAKEGDDAPDAAAPSTASTMATSTSNATIIPDAPDSNAPVPVGAERRERRERYAARERERLAAATANAVVGGTTAADAATVRGFRSAGILGAHPNTVSAVFGGVPAANDTPAAGPSRERASAAVPVAPPVESTRTRAMALLRRTAASANPLGAIGSPAPQRRDRDRETSNNYATFDTYMAERRRAETSAAAASSGASVAAPAVIPGFPNHLHHPQPQNPADIDRYLASFAVPPRRRVSRTSREGDSSRSGGTAREPPASGSGGSGAAGDQDNMVLE
ncbi:hypothetical protein B0H14DRAFT_3009686 [Mycena olivaceomarginata]|nr:hypothetical protein B0H14DRAFT_3009686 [Mycena olivaceomarginata]